MKEKIGLILPNHLGDVVMATPALRALRRGRPDAEIHAIVDEKLAPLLEGSPSIDRVWTHRLAEVRNPIQRALRRLELARRVAGLDCMIVLPNSFSSALLALVSRARRRLGYRRGGRGRLLTDALPPPREDGHRVPIAMERYYLNLVCHLGCPDTGTALELFVDERARGQCEGVFKAHGIAADRPLVCFAPGADFGPSKLWPLHYVAEVLGALQRDGAQVALVHGPGEEPLAEEILARCGPGVACLGGAGMTLSLLKAILARASLLVCNDAGARHIAAAFGVPALVMMGPTSIRYTSLNLGRTRILREPVECSPCQLKVCPIDHRCMIRLRPERVVAEARAALSEAGWKGDLELEPRA